MKLRGKTTKVLTKLQKADCFSLGLAAWIMQEITLTTCFLVTAVRFNNNSRVHCNIMGQTIDILLHTGYQETTNTTSTTNKDKINKP